MTPSIRFKSRHSRSLSIPAASVEAATLAERLVERLSEAGFDHGFGIPGRHVQSLFRHMAPAGLRPVLTRHEQGAVYMADGYARAGGKPALVLATAGPGAGNMVTGVANAFADGVPLLCLTGAPARHLGSRGAFQELGDDHTGVTPSIFAPITRYNAQLTHPDQWEPALQLALTGLAAGPVNLTIPADLLDAPARAAAPHARIRGGAAPDPEAVAQAARLLSAHPDALILAGRGALAASEALRAVAERLQVPVVTTVHGRGVLDEDHPLALGPQGFSASHWAERYLEAHRPAVVLAIGTSLREISTNVYSEVFAGTEALIHLTRDPLAIGRHYRTTVGAVADAEAFLQALLPLLPVRPVSRALAAFKAATPRFDAAALDEGPGRVSPRRVAEAMRRVLGAEDLLFVDTGNAIPWSVRYFPVHGPGTYFASAHLAAMGWGLAAAIGAAIARPDRRVAALVGDGCFQMSGMEIATAVQQELPVVWVVLNDARLNMVHQGSSRCYGRPVANTELSAVDCAHVAQGLGALGFHVEHPGDLEPTLRAALASGRPAVVDVAIHPDHEPPMAGRAQALRRFEERP